MVGLVSRHPRRRPYALQGNVAGDSDAMISAVGDYVGQRVILEQDRDIRASVSNRKLRRIIVAEQRCMEDLPGVFKYAHLGHARLYVRQNGRQIAVPPAIHRQA